MRKLKSKMLKISNNALIIDGTLLFIADKGTKLEILMTNIDDIITKSPQTAIAVVTIGISLPQLNSYDVTLTEVDGNFNTNRKDAEKLSSLFESKIGLIISMVERSHKISRKLILETNCSTRVSIGNGLKSPYCNITFKETKFRVLEFFSLN